MKHTGSIGARLCQIELHAIYTVLRMGRTGTEIGQPTGTFFFLMLKSKFTTDKTYTRAKGIP